MFWRLKWVNEEGTGVPVKASFIYVYQTISTGRCAYKVCGYLGGRSTRGRANINPDARRNNPGSSRGNSIGQHAKAITWKDELYGSIHSSSTASRP